MSSGIFLKMNYSWIAVICIVSVFSIIAIIVVVVWHINEIFSSESDDASQDHNDYYECYHEENGKSFTKKDEETDYGYYEHYNTNEYDEIML